MNTQRVPRQSSLFSPTSIVPWLIAFTLVIVGLFFLALRNASANQAQMTEKILVSISNDTVSWNDDTLYTLNPADGSGQAVYFNMHSQPKLKTGFIHAPRISTDGSQIYFHSEHANIYTPAGRNLFGLSTATKNLDQITPGPNSGIWGQTGNSTVSGRVQKSNGDPWINGSVYLEGMDSVFTGVDGTFRFDNVPAGVRWLVAYRPTLDAFEARSINVISNLNTTGLVLEPNTGSRTHFQHPADFGNRIYYQSFNQISWTDADFSPQNVYTSPADSCTGLPMIDAFDVGSQTGKIALYDYQTGCGQGNINHSGIYTLDKDGNNKQLLIDMLADSDWADPILPVEVNWSPDETRLAVKARYANIDYLLVYDTNGTLLGFAFADTTTETLTLQSWSPDGKWLLFSQYDGNPAQTTLGKIGVNPDGSLNNASITTLLANQPITGATWGNLADTPPPNPTPSPATSPTPTATPISNPTLKEKVYLPLVIR